MTKKMTTKPKSQIPKTKNTERKALFQGRVNTEAIQDQDFTSSHTHTHTQTHSHTLSHIKSQSILPSTPLSLSAHVSVYVRRSSR